MRTRLLPLALLLSLALFPGAAHAQKGLPVLGAEVSWHGVSTPPEGTVRYMTIPAGKGTVLAAVDMATGQVRRSRFLPTQFTVPLVAYDGSAGGLSADAKTLVLIRLQESFPRRNTTFAVLGTRGLKTRDVFTLRGDFSFDALSPDGRWLYVVQYLSPQDPSRYLVRLYDLQRHRMVREPIIDPREVGNVMRGMPVTRASSPDGRFAYTLYDGAGDHPFIHALDTVEKSARCIDLHGLMGFEPLSDLKLDVSPDGGTISVALGGQPMALVDTNTNEVTEPAAPETPADAVEDDPRSVPWLLVAAGTLGLLLVLLVARRFLKGGRRSRSPEPPEVLGGVGEEVEVELGDALLDDAPHGLAEVGHEAHEPKRPRVPIA